MTYLQFHFVFTLPPIVILSVLMYLAVRRGEAVAGWLEPHLSSVLKALGAMIALAYLYTTPWDNYLVAQDVWGYGDGRVLFTIGYVPFEEYLFFGLQAILTGLFVCWLARLGVGRVAQSVARPVLVRTLGALAWLGVSTAGVLLLTEAWGSYLGLILVWAGPIAALQWGFGGDLLASRWRLLLPGLGIPTLYLWVADRIAIGLGIWWISDEKTTGLLLLGLPIEEAIFFVMTNLMVGFGLTLALSPAVVGRLQTVLQIRWWRGALVLWALSMIPTPLIPDAFPALAYLSTTMLALGVLGYTLERYGRRAFLLFAVAFGFGVGIEWLGHTTGVPFGAYTYTAPGPMLLGVPLLVPLGWWAFTVTALAVSPTRYRVLFAPLALVAWDLGLDPLMVSKGFWAFGAGGVYYGIPVTNFLGWYVSGVILVLLMTWLEPRLRRDAPADLQFIFVAQAFLMSVGLLFFGLNLAALVTFVTMGLISLSLWRSEPMRSLFAQTGPREPST